ncbi:glycosyl hydrolase [Paenibacillus yonginensis]|uniref:Glycosyl hydrolase n=1 Tax=Paenibacillus yonginensis TaxID=1462996 RepID=A0A1B1N5Z1_9BACL|nr:ThuA domain-containing protein [Paenibacillus yonginensis]ANS76868.1 glycosyl hydrolase [Paenibacillus yonginensis]
MEVKTLLLGDQEQASYHPLEEVRETLTALLGTDFQVEAAEDRSHLSADRLSLSEYGLCISYTDSWQRAPHAREIAGLIQYVAGGGGLLAIHNGISLQAAPELAQLIGGKFTGHPKYTGLEFSLTEAEHPVSSGLQGFMLDEEPYRFELDPLAQVEVLLTYSHEGQEWPAAWARNYGLGRVVFLMPGHHLPSFQHEGYRQWIVQAARWAAGRL